ncbi:hypothetical protein ACIBH1_38080 [Nonomuraea sp. NPDC050663]|uniref:hypothetical protein n=1 Tax=Nonomuraea sp. NPDC050663 TaxID=3364370 RepID=UPI003788C858
MTADNDVGVGADPPADPTSDPPASAESEAEPAPQVTPPGKAGLIGWLENTWRRIVLVAVGVPAVVTAVTLVYGAVVDEPVSEPLLPVLKTGEYASPCFSIKVPIRPPEGKTWVVAVTGSETNDKYTYFYRISPGASRPLKVSLDARNVEAAKTWWDIRLMALPAEVVEHVRDAVGITGDQPWWKSTVMPLPDEAHHDSIQVQRGVGQDSC